MSLWQPEARGGAPIDNVQRFERLVSDAEFLQNMVDLGEDVDTLNELNNHLETEHLIGLPVIIIGGKVQAVAPDQETVIRTCFVDHEATEGEYRGVSWRCTPSEIYKGEYQWYLCHALLTGVNEEMDKLGNLHRTEHITYVTASSSQVQINTLDGSHDFRWLANDGFALRIDQMMLDDDCNIDKKLAIVAKMFGKIPDGLSMERRQQFVQRLSYLNYLKLFTGALCLTPIAYLRDCDNPGTLSILYGGTEGKPIVGTVRAVGLDNPLKNSNDEIGVTLDLDNQVICIEMDIVGYGLVSAPYISDKTVVYIAPKD